MKNKTIEAWSIDQSIRKQIILSEFDRLNYGEHFQLVHKIDPKPLRKFFEIERRGQFKWEYEEEKPLWKINIFKKDLSEFTVDQTIRAFPESIHFFEAIHFNYYVGSTENLEQACLQNGSKTEDLISYLRSAESSVVKYNLNDWSSSLIVDFLKENYHKPFMSTLRELGELINYVETAHDIRHPGFFIIKEEFENLSAEIAEHLNDENEVVFHKIKDLENEKLSEPEKIELIESLNWLKEDHILMNNSIYKLIKLFSDYQSKENVIPAIQLLKEKLDRFRCEMQIHLYIEEYILFQRLL